MKRKDKEKKNITKFKNDLKALGEEEINKHVKKNLHYYLSNALRISEYYGKLWIKYVGFNFTLIAFFISMLIFYIPFLSDLYPLFWGYIVGVFSIGFILYLIPYLYLFFKSYKTSSFKHIGLQHYSCITDENDYNVTKNLDKFIELIKRTKKEDEEEDKEDYSIKIDLEGLIVQYLHQANYNKVGVRLRNCLVWGFVLLIGSIIVSIYLIWYLNIILP